MLLALVVVFVVVVVVVVAAHHADLAARVDPYTWRRSLVASGSGVRALHVLLGLAV